MRAKTPIDTRLFALLLVVSARSSDPAEEVAIPSTPPNIVLVVADDFGVDLMPAYGEGSDLPCTPVLDQFASEGMLFRNVWVCPQCSPTRAQLLTGRYGFRNGIGTPANAELSLDEQIVPELLAGYSSACAGKWHLGGTNGGLTHPNDSGFDKFAGSTANLSDYYNWTKTEDGEQTQTMTYATVDTAEEAIQALQELPEPFFLYVAFNAPHSPAHIPDANLCPDACGTGVNCADVTETGPNWAKTRAVVSAMDHEIGRILGTLNTVDPEAYVFFIGDNGTGVQVTRAPFLADHAKGTIYEGGINVPLVVRGPGVAPGSECAGLVSGIDLFATFADLASIASPAQDSVSLVPYFTDPALALRTLVYTESFQPNNQASLPFASHERAVRNERYKLIRRTGESDELYDLEDDPWEATDLVPDLAMGTDEDLAYLALVAELDRLGVGQ